MNFEFDKKMEEDRNAFINSNKRNEIYEKYLVPLKAKISQILLYDTEAAYVFLQKYNEIAKKDTEISAILSDISDLELKIQEYEEGKGKEKLFKEQSKTIVQQIENLQSNCEQLEIEDFENKFLSLTELYNKNIENYSYTDRDIIEQHIASLQAKLIIMKVRNGAIDLHSEISEKDEARLAIIMNNEIYTLMQSKNPNVQNIVDEIKYKMIDRTDAVYDPEIWGLLDSAQRGGEKIEQIKGRVQQLDTTSSSALLPAIPKKRKSFLLPSLDQIFQKTLKIGDQRMKLSRTIQIGDRIINVKDLSKIDMDWLSEQVSQEMLNELELERIIKEIRKEPTRYLDYESADDFLDIDLESDDIRMGI